jgi:hypothetical protein
MKKRREKSYELAFRNSFAKNIYENLNEIIHHKNVIVLVVHRKRRNDKKSLFNQIKKKLFKLIFVLEDCFVSVSKSVYLQEPKRITH